MMTPNKVYKNKQYDSFADKFRLSQEEFYSKKIDESRKELYELLGDSLNGKRLLDVGCGFGKDIPYYIRNGATVFGVDISREMIKIAKQKIVGADLSVQNYSKTDYKSEYFDTIVSRYALQYSRNLKKTFQEIYRILRPGGVFIFLVSHPLVGYIAKKNKNYHKQEVVSVPLFEGKIKVSEPTHTLSEYLSDYMLSNFDLLAQREGAKSENKFPGHKIPDFILFKFKKK